MSKDKSGGAGKSRGGFFGARESEAWKQQLKTEMKIVQPITEQQISDIKETGDLYRENAYLNYYKSEASNTHKEIEFTLDKIQDHTEFDPKCERETCHPLHKRRANGLQSSRCVTSSQIYGWYRPIDQPKYGYERSAICQASFMDSSHLGNK